MKNNRRGPCRHTDVILFFLSDGVLSILNMDPVNEFARLECALRLIIRLTCRYAAIIPVVGHNGHYQVSVSQRLRLRR